MTDPGSPRGSGNSTPDPAAEPDQTSCWECSRRRLVCDGDIPTCKKCRVAGIVCPGYSSAKPLRWLAPGRVNARIRRKARTVPRNATPRSTPKPAGEGAAAASTAESSAKDPKDAGVPAPREGSETNSGSGSSLVYSSGQVSSESWQLSERGVSSDWALESGGTGPPGSKPLTDEVPRSPSRGITVSVETEIVQATYYYNYHVLPEYCANQFIPTVFVVPVPLESVSVACSSIIHLLVSVAIRHRIYRVASNSGKELVVDLRHKYYEHRQKAIMAFNSEIQENKNPYLMMVCAVLFVYAELQQSGSTSWKVHMDALMGMISHAGGPMKICRRLPGFKITIILYVMYINPPAFQHWHGNPARRLTKSELLPLTFNLCHRMYTTSGTTSPPLTSTLKQAEVEEMLQFTEEMWEEIPYPGFLCPAPVLMVMIRINHLRGQRVEDPNAETETTEILSAIKAFSPEAWAAAKPYANEKWLLIARCHHSAAILYCIATLGGHLPASSLQEIEVLRTVHADLLVEVLREVEHVQGVRMGCLWPLVVAAVEVAKHDWGVRVLVRRWFDMFAHDLATPLMLEAKSVMERFWGSGKVGWDECFDKPYAFVL